MQEKQSKPWRHLQNSKWNFAITSVLSKNGQSRGKEKIDHINPNDKLYWPLRQKIQSSKNEEPNRAQYPLFEV
jgi:hypothetical protein